MKNRELDDLLKNWAGRVQAGDSRIERIAGDVSRSLAGQTFPVEEEVKTPSVFWPRLAWAVGGVILGFVMALACFHAGWLGGGDLNGGAVSLARISSNLIQGQKVVFNEMENLFQDRLRWIVSSGNNVQMGIAGEGEAVAGTRPMLVRVVVLRRGIGENKWKSIWDTDVLARGEEFVESAPNPGRDNRLCVWVCPNVDGTLVVESHVALEAPVEIASSTSSVVKPGAPVQLLSLRTDEADYCVYQTVDWLNGDKG